eukprot:6186279-Prymnesium_polylepis.1
MTYMPCTASHTAAAGVGASPNAPARQSGGGTTWRIRGRSLARSSGSSACVTKYGPLQAAPKHTSQSEARPAAVAVRRRVCSHASRRGSRGCSASLMPQKTRALRRGGASRGGARARVSQCWPLAAEVEFELEFELEWVPS